MSHSSYYVILFTWPTVERKAAPHYVTFVILRHTLHLAGRRAEEPRGLLSLLLLDLAVVEHLD